MSNTSSAVYTVPPVCSERSASINLPPFDFSVRRTAASEQLAMFERTSVAGGVNEQWMDNPPLLKPGKTTRIEISYTIGARMEFPPLGSEDERFLKSGSAE